MMSVNFSFLVMLIYLCLTFVNIYYILFCRESHRFNVKLD